MEILDTASSLENTISFSEDEIAIVKAALKSKLYRRDEPRDVRVRKFQAMLTALSEKFEIPEVRLEMVDGDGVGWIYEAEANRILAARFSLVSILDGFAEALMFARNRGLPAGAPPRMVFNPLAFGLSAFKQAAPEMFDDAKHAGKLVGTSVPYTDNGRLRSARGTDRQEPDIDPENRRPGDRGNGLGED
jgi:hypothetical protein